jgi:hypothetical protein
MNLLEFKKRLVGLFNIGRNCQRNSDGGSLIRGCKATPIAGVAVLGEATPRESKGCLDAYGMMTRADGLKVK